MATKNQAASAAAAAAAAAAAKAAQTAAQNKKKKDVTPTTTANTAAQQAANQAAIRQAVTGSYNSAAAGAAAGAAQAAQAAQARATGQSAASTPAVTPAATQTAAQNPGTATAAPAASSATNTASVGISATSTPASAVTTTPAATTPTATNAALEALKAAYAEVGQYKGKTEEEIRQQAEGEYKSKYDLLIEQARQAKEKQDLALQQEREGLGASYDRKRENTNDTYAKNRSAADRQALTRGMQRSSYNNQTLANIDSEKAKALSDIDTAQTTAESNIDKKIAQLAAQLAETEKGYETARADDIMARIRELQDQEYDRKTAAEQIRVQLAGDLYNKEYQSSRDAVTDANWREKFDYQKKSDDQKIAMEIVMASIKAGNNPTDDILARAGLSRADANSMIQQVQEQVSTGGGGGYYGGTIRRNNSTGNNTEGASSSTPTDASSDENLNYIDNPTTHAAVAALGIPERPITNTGNKKWYDISSYINNYKNNR